MMHGTEGHRSSSLDVGARLLDRYDLVDEAWRGREGDRFVALDERGSQSLTFIHTIPAHVATSPEAMQRLTAACKTARELAHASIIRLAMLVTQGTPPFLAIEFFEGRSLDATLQDGEKVALSRVVATANGVLAALEAAAAVGLHHGDITPANVLYRDRGASQVIKVGGFGFAAHLRPAIDDETCDSPKGFRYHYVAPEVVAGGEGGPAADQYGLAATLYRLLSGRAPFAACSGPLAKAIAATPPPALTDVPPHVAAALQRAMAKDPAQRFTDCASFCRALEAPAAGAVEAPQPAALPQGPSVLPGPAVTPTRRASAPRVVVSLPRWMRTVAAAATVAAGIWFAAPAACEYLGLSEAPVSRSSTSSPAAKHPAKKPPAKTAAPVTVAAVPTPPPSTPPPTPPPSKPEPVTTVAAVPEKMAPVPVPPPAVVELPATPEPQAPTGQPVAVAAVQAAPSPRRPVRVERPVDVVPDRVERAHGLLNFVNGLGMSFVWYAPGTFTMGDETEGDDDAVPLHRRTVGRGFWLAACEVSQEQYAAVMGSNPSSFVGADLPVDGVSWREAVAFCQALTRLERQRGALPDGYVYSLPTEAQWEYACRVGYSPSALAGDLWARPRSCGRPRPVSAGRPDRQGCCNLLGNVDEWCLDRRSRDYAGAFDDERPTADEYDERYIQRGGSWRDDEPYCRPSYRGYGRADGRHGNSGFRCAVIARSLLQKQPRRLAVAGGLIGLRPWMGVKARAGETPRVAAAPPAKDPLASALAAVTGVH